MCQNRRLGDVLDEAGAPREGCRKEAAMGAYVPLVRTGAEAGGDRLAICDPSFAHPHGTTSLRGLK